MIYKGIQYTIAATAEPDIWRWQFQIGDSVRTGRTQTRLAELAARRVRSKIDTALRALAASSRPERNDVPAGERHELGRQPQRGLAVFGGRPEIAAELAGSSDSVSVDAPPEGAARPC